MTDKTGAGPEPRTGIDVIVATAREMAARAGNLAFEDAINGGCSAGEAARRASVEARAVIAEVQENLRKADIWLNLGQLMREA